MEYNDNLNSQIGAGVDVDQRIIPLPPPPPNIMPQLDLGQGKLYYYFINLITIL